MADDLKLSAPPPLAEVLDVPDEALAPVHDIGDMLVALGNSYKQQHSINAATKTTFKQHHASLTAHAARINGNTAMMTKQSVLLQAQGATLDDHVGIIGKHGATLKAQGSTLDDHAEYIKEIGAYLVKQAPGHNKVRNLLSKTTLRSKVNAELIEQNSKSIGSLGLDVKMQAEIMAYNSGAIVALGNKARAQDNKFANVDNNIHMLVEEVNDMRVVNTMLEERTSSNEITIDALVRNNNKFCGSLATVIAELQDMKGSCDEVKATAKTYKITPKEMTDKYDELEVGIASKKRRKRGKKRSNAELREAGKKLRAAALPEDFDLQNDNCFVAVNTGYAKMKAAQEAQRQKNQDDNEETVVTP